MLRIAYLDASCVVVSKPHGLPSVPGKTAELQDCLSRRVASIFTDALVVHRLDMATSGLMVFARGLAVQRTQSAQFANREVVKHYSAWVQGLVAMDHGVIDLPLSADWPQRPRQKIDIAEGKQAVTQYRVLTRDTVRHQTRLELQPLTGRTHQLRVHLASLGHPICGDRLYGDATAPVATSEQHNRLMLHATALAFAHPVNGAWMAFQDAAPF